MTKNSTRQAAVCAFEREQIYRGGNAGVAAGRLAHHRPRISLTSDRIGALSPRVLVVATYARQQAPMHFAQQAQGKGQRA